MQANKGRDTAPEVALRRELFRRGYRYRIHARLIPNSRRTVDIAFAGARIAVFVDGCFWHGCPTHGTQPKANADFWKSKIETNRVRDADTSRTLAEAGWKVVRVWEHEDPISAANRVAFALEGRTG